MSFSREYTLSSPTGMEITLMEMGASLIGVKTADRHGVLSDVALPLKGPDDISCAGATLAPYAGRIARGDMKIDGRHFQLSLNEGRRMRLYTDQPCLMLYSGGYLDTPNCAITFEALEHPLSPCAKTPPILYPGGIYRRRIVYHFDTIRESP